ncbi:jouberin isoform X1 [Colius striatus]|uniref:jouberin isoform X1 n=1 Tax=Colius striatus TaxID=57412 RepID=UPI002B1D5E55|nr:jouberin isoform X1 [Colius striatus]XP_061846770.1 jouberin isoform X1 [Colius striatus]XP_061846771.1 jouberin isoform X1 [Colius striatus]
MPAVESEAKAKTKVRFEEIFRRHADLTDTKKSKKKKFHSQENIVLDTFRSNIDLAKESVNDEAIINNTYNPEEESPRFTKNKLREKASIAEKINNDIVSGEEDKQPNSNKKKKKSLLQEQLNEEENLCEDKLESFEKKINDFPKKKTKSKSQTDAPHQEGDRKIKNSLTEARNVTELEEEEALIRAYQLHVAEDEANAIKKKIRMKLKEQMSESTSTVQSHEVVLNNEVGKKKKKKKEVTVLSEAETSAMSLSELQHQPVEDDNQSLERLFPSERQKLEERMEKQKPRAKKVKKKTRKEENTEIAAEDDEEMKISEITTRSKLGFDDDLVLGVYIHRSDRLKSDLLISHPMVKIHIVDQTSGLYVKKDHSKRKVSAYEQEQIEHILPITTQPYDFRQSKSTVPEWEEQIIFNERFSYFTQNTEESPRVILFFEILDFQSKDEVRVNLDVQIQECGFRKICWAFLKLVGANGVLNIDGKLRLQLYYPPPRTKSHSNTVEIYDWWAKCPRNRYPSTLYVTVRGIRLPDHVAPSFCSVTAVQPEQSSATLCELQRDGSKKSCELTLEEKKEPIKWTRFPGQACRIPNKHLFSLRGGDMGCFCIRFSHDGKILAAACAGRNGYPIVLYEIPSGQFLREFYGHLNIVYDLCWSKDNQHLLTASSDGTVRMWKIEMQAASAVRVFPHPSFVYTAKYHPIADSLVVTGCYDSVIRIWNANVKEIHGQLLQELDGHRSFINTLCFDAEGLHMFSGDNSGLIIVWDTSVKGSSQHLFQNWKINKEIKENDIKGTPINHLEVHPNGRRLLIHAKDSTLRIMDLRILAMKKYIGATNYREKIHSTLTPCGTFLFSGSEDGKAYVWNPETGDQVAIYSELSFTSPLRDVAFHPHEHMVSFCAFGQNQPILVYIYDYKVAQQEAELIKDLSSSLTAPRGPQFLSSFSEIPVQKSSMMSPADQFVSVARASMRMQKVKQKLDSVMTSSNLLFPAPSSLSPHSMPRLPGSLSTPLNPLDFTRSGCFSPVGNPLSRTLLGRLQTSDDCLTALGVGRESSCPLRRETVVALYDYTAHRSDELTIHRSDIIQVLYKDNDNWWFGSLANGQQGYFPANYVASEKVYEEQASGLVPDSTPLLLEGPTEAEEGSPTLRKMSPVISKSGDLKCSLERDTDRDLPATEGAKKKKKRIQRNERENQHNLMGLDTPVPSVTANDVENEPTAPGVELKKKKKKAMRGSNLSTNGKTNTAFEPECCDI